ncbi:MAG TPA: protein translocase subunit SecD [Acidimicrobiia bacterium]|jgi:preprotein translocase subunit SecD
MRRNLWFLTVTVVLIVGAFVATLLSDNRPILGLDLQGGISVVLAPVGKVRSEASLNKAVDIIRNRVDALGVAEPEISRQGHTVIIDLPGVKDRDKARRIVGKTAELRFRPVLAQLPPYKSTTPTTKKATSQTTGAAGATSSSTASTTTTTDPSNPKSSTAAEDTAGATVILPGRGTGNQAIRYQLGPAALTGKDVSGAKAVYNPGSGQGWTVDLSLKSSGQALFNQLAKTSFPKQPPQNAVAIVLDGVVQSAPAFQTSNFDGDVSISGNFSESDAKDLATVLQYGALPVQLKELTTESVSPTLGTDQLHAGIAAGVIGLALVALYMLVFYRILGLVVISGLLLSAMAIYAIISYLGSSIGLTLTLAGVTGLIVSVGVTVDSYVVYFEKLKDEVRTGRSVRSSVDRAFEKSFRTILAADFVSLIGAVVLYALAIGSVRGFAFFLGISVVLDLLISYFFMHPLVYFMVQRGALVRAKKVGIAAGLDAVGVTA